METGTAWMKMLLVELGTAVVLHGAIGRAACRALRQVWVIIRSIGLDL